MASAAALMFISAGASAASGVIGYMGAQQQAQAIQQQAEYNAAVQRNNAIGAKQDSQFQAGLSEFNKAKTEQERSAAMQKFREDSARALASKQARLSRQGLVGGSFGDILKSDALKIEREENEMLWSSSFAPYQASKQGQLALEQGRIAYSHGMASASATLHVGRANAREARTSGIGSLIGGFAGAASATAQGFHMR